MPHWRASTILAALTNVVLLAAGALLVAYSEGVFRNGTALYEDFETPFQDFALTSITWFAATAMVTAFLGIIVAGILGHLNKTRQRTSPDRITCDTVFDVFLALYLIAVAVVMILCLVTACFATYFNLESQAPPTHCPGTFDVDQQPLPECGFDNAMFVIVNGAVGSNQFATIWSTIQDELSCCGYWCPSTNVSLVCH